MSCTSSMAVGEKMSIGRNKRLKSSKRRFIQTEGKHHTFLVMKNDCFRYVPTRTWRNLHYEVLVKIFMKLSIMDLIYGASGVCTSWRAASRDPRLWGTLDVKTFNSGFPNFLPRRCTWSTLIEPRGVRLMNVLTKAISLSHSKVTRLIFDFNECITDEHLIFVAERCSNLKQLVLPAWNQMTANGLCNAIRHLGQLESLTLPCNYCPTRIIEMIGSSCPNLNELKLMCPYDYDIATTLFVYIPTLKVLSLRCSLVHKDALIVTLMFFDFEVLNLSHSLILEKDQRGVPVPSRWENIELIAEKWPKFKRFFACGMQGCVMCRLVLKDGGRLKWHEYEEGLWRKDEVRSFSV